MRHRVLMVSDFFYPNFGGVESHIYQLSQRLIQLGHKVVVMTHAYGNRTGVRVVTNGLKVYYVPRVPFYSVTTVPNVFGGFPVLRVILIRERISIVHCHQAGSGMGGNAMVQARTMGYKVVFTEHSLFGFADTSSVFLNKALKFPLSDIHHAICVSHTSKENLVLRACIPPTRVSVIPNAVDASQFEPDISKRQPGVITIVALTRLVYRKGLDLLAVIIPEICRRHANYGGDLGGSGPKEKLLEEVVNGEDLSDRVTLLPGVPHSQARDILVQGDIFVNSSLTEAFCIAIVEAASTGLRVVSTKVGGVPEVLPSDMMILANPDPLSLLEAIEEAISTVHLVDPWAQHAQVKTMYSWQQVAKRTEQVYNTVANDAMDDSMVGRLNRVYKCGPWAGKLFCILTSIMHLYWWLLEYWWPEDEIDIAPDLNIKEL